MTPAWRLRSLGLAAVLLGLYWYSAHPREPHLDWQTAIWGGIPLEVKLTDANLSLEARMDLQDRILERIDQVTAWTSDFDPDSVVSRFNRAPAGAGMELDPALADLLGRARYWHDLTGGAFDITLGPLMRRWGFRDQALPEQPPSDAELAALPMGWSGIHLSERRLEKRKEGLTLDLGAIAKGFAVDRVADLLLAAGYTNLYVNIGGEVRAQGLAPAGRPWRLGIEVPRRDAGAPEALAIVSVPRLALATSGDYRKFIQVGENQFLPHIMDPRLRCPVIQNLASVSVIAPTCQDADALATALMVLGVEAGTRLVESLDGFEALFIERSSDGNWTQTATSGFDRYRVILPPETPARDR